MASAIVGAASQTSFDKGVSRFTWLMIRFMLVMVPLVFLINGFTKHDWNEAFFFALAVAVGLTPEMLPMIVTVCLSKGAIAMSRKKVIVKRLNAIQNFGAMDVLCTDKTGTLTMDHVILEKYCDVVREDRRRRAADGVSQQLLPDRPEKRAGPRHPRHTRAARRVRSPSTQGRRNPLRFPPQNDVGGRQDAGRPAPPDRQGRSGGDLRAAARRFELDGKFYPMEQILIDDLREEYDELSADGFRVLALAYKRLASPSAPTPRTTKAT